MIFSHLQQCCIPGQQCKILPKKKNLRPSQVFPFILNYTQQEKRLPLLRQPLSYKKRIVYFFLLGISKP